MAPRLRRKGEPAPVYGKTLADGLRVIASDHDTNVMVSVAEKLKSLVVYFDHEDQVGGVEWDDVVANPVAEFPKVLSPKKVVFMDKNPGEKLPVFYTNTEKTRVEQSHADEEGGNDETGSGDEGFMDSDYEIDNGDEDLVEENIDVGGQVLKDNKKAKGSKLKV
ncbi:hypothetical protein U9M48_044563 [Paspalum notatum var. saurae]|uniref:Uncharacterized protein n=1 Tax=Paspalum notatum var. saurae TaxID=547442 RepID=A0AAQ3XIE7_PASNO